MKWLLLWVLLTLAYAVGWGVARIAGRSGASLGEELTALAVVPLVQLVALGVLLATRRHRARRAGRDARPHQIPPNQG